MTDRIVYKVVSKPGGVDGRDPSDKGGHVKYASFDRIDAEKHVDSWSKLEVGVIEHYEKHIDVGLGLTEKSVGPLLVGRHNQSWKSPSVVRGSLRVRSAPALVLTRTSVRSVRAQGVSAKRRPNRITPEEWNPVDSIRRGNQANPTGSNRS